jgi:hypothetical protein
MYDLIGLLAMTAVLGGCELASIGDESFLAAS